MLQDIEGAKVRQNGNDIGQGKEWHLPVEPYPSKELSTASSSSADKKRSEGLRGVEAVIWPERRCSGGGVRCRSSESGQLGR